MPKKKTARKKAPQKKAPQKKAPRKKSAKKDDRVYIDVSEEGVETRRVYWLAGVPVQYELGEAPAEHRLWVTRPLTMADDSPEIFARSFDGGWSVPCTCLLSGEDRFVLIHPNDWEELIEFMDEPKPDIEDAQREFRAQMHYAEFEMREEMAAQERARAIREGRAPAGGGEGPPPAAQGKLGF